MNDIIHPWRHSQPRVVGVAGSKQKRARRGGARGWEEDMKKKVHSLLFLKFKMSFFFSRDALVLCVLFAKNLLCKRASPNAVSCLVCLLYALISATRISLLIAIA